MLAATGGVGMYTAAASSCYHFKGDIPQVSTRDVIIPKRSTSVSAEWTQSHVKEAPLRSLRHADFVPSRVAPYSIDTVEGCQLLRAELLEPESTFVVGWLAGERAGGSLCRRTSLLLAQAKVDSLIIR